ncbi:MAG TPA: ABC transporter permease, partial [Candidatus Angelobacter sp.]
VIFFNYLFPLIFFFTFGTVFHAGESVAAVTQVITMSLALGVLGSGLFGAGIRALQERELNILRRYKVTPITPGPLLVASMVTGWIVFMPYILLMLALAHYYYHMPWPQHMFSLLVFISIGLIAFRAIGMVIASVANTMQEGTILVQLLYFPMLFLSGATFPAENFPPSLQIISNFIPATYYVAGIKGIIKDNQGLNWGYVGALLLTTLVGFIVGMKLFRWEKEEKIKGSAKLWVAGVLAPFLVLGVYQSLHRNPRPAARPGPRSARDGGSQPEIATIRPALRLVLGKTPASSREPLDQEKPDAA